MNTTTIGTEFEKKVYSKQRNFLMLRLNTQKFSSIKNTPVEEVAEKLKLTFPLKHTTHL